MKDESILTEKREEGKEKQEKLERNGKKKKVREERTAGCWKERRREAI